MTIQVTLLDAGTGNLRSVHKALEALGARVRLTSEAEVARQGGRVILPGVGAFGDFMAGLAGRGLDKALVEVLKRGDPVLGICVGMQALFERSEELGDHAGLGLLPGRVVHFPVATHLKIPHTGWNQLWMERESPLWQEIQPGAYAYFNHSYFCLPAEPGDLLLSTDYGLRFASAVQRENLYGVQFHPEKSQWVGLRLLANFLHTS
jgi:glutamine amidotransferase